jgi:RNA polymerase sigma-70 factor (ECF subfamily)
VNDVERFYADHRDGVFRYLRRMVGAPETARDLTQEVFLRVSRAGVPDAPDIGRRAWVFRIARNLALNHLRDTSRRPMVVELRQPAVSAPQELGMALRDAIGRLSPGERDVFLLREHGGLTYQEIAEASGMTADGVRAALHRARQQLRAELRGELHRRKETE